MYVREYVDSKPYVQYKRRGDVCYNSSTVWLAGWLVVVVVLPLVEPLVDLAAARNLIRLELFFSFFFFFKVDRSIASCYSHFSTVGWIDGCMHACVPACTDRIGNRQHATTYIPIAMQLPRKGENIDTVFSPSLKPHPP